MNRLISLAPTSNTPSVMLDADSGFLEFKGKSIPENSIQFYRVIFDWLDDYLQNPQNETKVNVDFKYFNTSSSKCILEIFKKLKGLKSKGLNLTVNWFYEEEDEDIKEAGEDFSHIVNIPFQILVLDEK